jgi:hypothetical protein
MRKQERAQLIYFLRIFNEGNSELLGQLTNITSGGIKLIGENPVIPGTKLHLKMDLPHTSTSDGHLTFAAECIWCKKEHIDECYFIGFKIDKISGENLKTVKLLIKDYYREDLPEDPLLDMNPPVEEK